jgi:hypothetical protein
LVELTSLMNFIATMALLSSPWSSTDIDQQVIVNLYKKGTKSQFVYSIVSKNRLVMKIRNFEELTSLSIPSSVYSTLIPSVRQMSIFVRVGNKVEQFECLLFHRFEEKSLGLFCPAQGELETSILKTFSSSVIDRENIMHFENFIPPNSGII